MIALLGFDVAEGEADYATPAAIVGDGTLVLGGSVALAGGFGVSNGEVANTAFPALVLVAASWEARSGDRSAVTELEKLGGTHAQK